MDTTMLEPGYEVSDNKIERLSQLASVGNDDKGLSLITDYINKVNTELTNLFDYYLNEKDIKVINGRELYRLYKDGIKTNSFMTTLDIFAEDYQKGTYEDPDKIYKASPVDISIVGHMNFMDCGLINGKFFNGNFFGGVFNGGTYHGGIYFNGTFDDKIIIYGGEFHGGIYSNNLKIFNGLFYNGNFCGPNIIIYNGEFHNGNYYSDITIYNGTFFNGDFYSGNIYNGTFISGTFHSQGFFDGIYKTTKNTNEYFKGSDYYKTIFIDNHEYIKITRWEYLKLRLQLFLYKKNIDITFVKTNEFKGIFKRVYQNSIEEDSTILGTPMLLNFLKDMKIIKQK